jgi:hypothetical protein
MPVRAGRTTRMDSKQFDRLAQSFGQPGSRRSLTRLLGGLGYGGVLSV